MKKTIVTTLLMALLATGSFAQSKSEERAKEKRRARIEELTQKMIYGDSDTSFNATTAPAKWSKESAVMLNQKFAYVFGNEYISIRVRRRILLQDKSAVEEFSKIYCDQDLNDPDNHRIAVRVIKPDGKQTIINANDALVEKKGNVPKVFKSFGKNIADEYFKIAVSNLEVGDIVDYSIEEDIDASRLQIQQQTDPYYRASTSSYGPFFPIELYSLSTDLTASMPIVKQTFDIELGTNYLITYNSSNGAPEWKYEAGDDRVKFYTVVDNNRDKAKDTRWLIETRELPSIKFNVLYSFRGKVPAMTLDKTRLIVNENRDVPLTKVTSKDIRYKMAYMTNNYERYAYQIEAAIVAAKKTLGRNLSDVDPVKLLDFFYYFSRKNFTNLDNGLSDEFFVTFMYRMGIKFNVPLDVIVVPVKACNTLDDVLSPNEILYCIKYKERYYYPPNKLSNTTDIDNRYEGRAGKYANMEGRMRGDDIVLKDCTIPASTESTSLYNSIYTVSINEDMTELKVREEEKRVGACRASSNEVIFDADGILGEEDDIAMGVEVQEKKDEKLNKREQEKKRKRDEEIVEYREKFMKVHKDNLEEAYDKLISLDSFECANTGRIPDSASTGMLIIKEYKLGDLIKKVGNNYVLEAGKIIGKQIELKPEEKIRHHSIYIDQARTLIDEVRINIPAGYKAEGVDNLTFNVDNDAGSFVSKARIENNQIIIVATKKYKRTLLKKEEWNKVMDFLDAAYNFTQKKVILKKA